MQCELRCKTVTRKIRQCRLERKRKLEASNFSVKAPMCCHHTKCKFELGCMRRTYSGHTKNLEAKARFQINDVGESNQLCVSAGELQHQCISQNLQAAVHLGFPQNGRILLTESQSAVSLGELKSGEKSKAFSDSRFANY